MSTPLTPKKNLQLFPKFPGVYEFRDKQGKILYIGKATSLKDRIGSYFQIPKGSTLAVAKVEPWTDPRIANMISQVTDIKIHRTDSVLEALILEANLIKKHQPKYNVREKDDKSFVYAVITKEAFPRVLIVRETELETQNSKLETKNYNSKLKTKKILNTKYQIPYTKIYGPYTSKKQLEIALKLIRKIFPISLHKRPFGKCCLDYQLGKCPGPYAGAISKKDYLKNIDGIEMILKGEKKKSVIRALKKRMKNIAKNVNLKKRPKRGTGFLHWNIFGMWR